MFSRAISGEQLIELFDGTYRKLLAESGLAVSTRVALARIEEAAPEFVRKFGLSPLDHLRDRLHMHLCTGCLTANAFLVVAPHTHWTSLNPVVISMNSGLYTIGPRKNLMHERILVPVSFLLHQQMAIPYEWADSSISTEQFDDAFNVIENVARDLHDFPSVLGISINFRFKKSLNETALSCIENPLDEFSDAFDEASLIEPIDFMKAIDFDYETVGWSANSLLSTFLTEEEIKIARLLRAIPEAMHLFSSPVNQ